MSAGVQEQKKNSKQPIRPVPVKALDTKFWYFPKKIVAMSDWPFFVYFLIAKEKIKFVGKVYIQNPVSWPEEKGQKRSYLILCIVSTAIHCKT